MIMTSQKCVRKLKDRKPTVNFITEKKNYICGCVAEKGSVYKDDTCWLCLKGKYNSTNLEMTKAEALSIISILTANLFSLNALEDEVSKNE